MNDFDTLIQAMLKSGETPESIAEKFTKSMNDASAANKRKEEVEYWVEESLDTIYLVLEKEAPFDYSIAGLAAALACLSEYPDLTLDELKELASANGEAIREAAKFYYKVNHTGKDKLDTFADAIGQLIAETSDKVRKACSKEKKDQDSDAIERFLRNL